ncbi:MAG: hypothetical protein ACR2KU_06545 [Gammaproteobacteria bacterium]
MTVKNAGRRPALNRTWFLKALDFSTRDNAVLVLTLARDDAVLIHAGFERRGSRAREQWREERQAC